MKDTLQLALPFLRLMLAQLCLLTAAHAAPETLASYGVGVLDGGGTVAISRAVKSTDGLTLKTLGNGIRRSRTYPFSITKIRAFSKTFGYLRDGNKYGQLFLLKGTISAGGGMPSDLHRPDPVGRSP